MAVPEPVVDPDPGHSMDSPNNCNNSLKILKDKIHNH